MIFSRFIVAGILRRWGSAALTVCVGALGVAGLIIVLWAQNAVPEAVKARISETDMVVGPKASGLDLALCCALHQTPAPGLVSIKTVEDRLKTPDVKPYIRQAVPIALGDNIDGHRIVWTRPDIIGFYKARLKQGTVWNQPMQIVAGAEVARALNLRIGQTLHSSHGLSAEGEGHEAPYKVTGILVPTGGVLDHLLLADLGSVAHVHEHHDHETGAHHEHDHEPDAPSRVNAVLVRFTSPIAQASVPLLINESEALSAASPQLELARLMSLIRPLIRFTTALFSLIALVAGLILTLTLVQALNRRARDLSLLRFMGASHIDLMLIVLGEALLLSHAALIAGIILGFIGQTLMQGTLTTYGLSVRTGLPLDNWTGFYACGLALTLISAIIPAVRLWRTRDDEGFRS